MNVKVLSTKPCLVIAKSKVMIVTCQLQRKLWIKLPKQLRFRRAMTTKTNSDRLNFRGDNPGAVQYGNFINYYQFHPPEQRIDLLPTDVWVQNDPFVVLDIGCNAGVLTFALYNFLTKNVNKNCYVLGIDIDPVLIERANESNMNNNITFVCLDFMNANERVPVISRYLESVAATKFSACFCFSITMWIHLNHGDEGLRTFLNCVCKDSDMVVVEPQPWKCYKSAVKRMKLSHYEFIKYSTLLIRNNVEIEIDKILQQIIGVTKVRETSSTSWGRKISFYNVSR